MDSFDNRYNPGPDFEENTKDPLVDFSLTDSSELWLIQWPINQASISLLQPADFNGKEMTLKLHKDGKLGGFDTSTGKSYDLVSYAAHEPDATVFLASGSETKIVGKIARRVCLVRYPEPSELKKSEGSARRSYPSCATSLRKNSRSHGSLASAYDPQVQSTEMSHKSKKRYEARITPSEASAKSAQRSSHAFAPDNENSKKKKVKVEE
ncbi:hypothetical protein ZIOFF_069332 [Zingiber officinale]|uniref:Mediator-associated protein 2 n=1 Tax=Zingiber officinale TaxID=94328 RepID=A0A8J5C400_ZINOF|nr:hypothetical protein ZIOFF_069332 [Zingiber officinale]